MAISKVKLPDNTVQDIKDARMGNARIFHGTCSTAAATTAKVVTCNDFTSAELVKGALIYVTFDYTNSGAVADITLDVNNTGARSIKKETSTSSGGSTANLQVASQLQANNTYLFQYNGTYWVCMTMDHNTNTTYSSMTTAEINAGTGTTARLITPARLKHAVETWAPEPEGDFIVPVSFDYSGSQNVVTTTVTYAELLAAVEANKKIIALCTDVDDDSYSWTVELTCAFKEENSLYLTSVYSTIEGAEVWPETLCIYANSTSVDVSAGTVDSTPTQYSNNLVTSGGVYNALQTKYTKPSTGIPASDLADGVVPGDFIIPIRINDSVTPWTYSTTTTASALIAANTANKRLVANFTFISLQSVSDIIYHNVVLTAFSAVGSSNPIFYAVFGISDNSSYFANQYSNSSILELYLTPSTNDALQVAVKSPDTAPTNNSTKLITSGGVYTALSGKYTKPSTGIPASDLESGVIPTVPTISTNVVSDKASDTKTSSPKSVYDEIHPAVVTTQPSSGFVPNVLYRLGTLTGSKTFTLASPSDSAIVNHYYWTFTAGSTAPTITWPSGISWFGGSAPTITAGNHYDVSILDNIAVCMEV